MNIDYKKIANNCNVSEKEVEEIEKELKRFMLDKLRKAFKEETVNLRLKGFGNFIVNDRLVQHRIHGFLKKFNSQKEKNLPYSEKDVNLFRKLWEYRQTKLPHLIQDTRREKYKNPFFAHKNKSNEYAKASKKLNS
jgi:nucleoid DNA-binding protein